MDHDENMEWETNIPSFDYSAEMKRIRRNLRKRNFFTICTCLVLVIALALGTIQYGIPALEKRYWDPNTSTYAEGSSDLEITMAVYTELFYPQYDLLGLQITDTGFSRYDITATFSKWVDNDTLANQVQNPQTATIDKGVLSFPAGFWDNTLYNPLDSALIFHDVVKARTLSNLKNYPDYINLLAAVTFSEDVPVNNSYTLIHDLHSIKNLSFIWAAVQTQDSAERGSPACGYSLRGYHHYLADDFSYDAEYPYLLGSTSCSVMERHFQSMLQYMADRQEDGTGILPPGSEENQNHYTDALEYIETNGMNIYGGFVIGSPQALLKLYESGKIDNLYLCDAWINY